MNVNQEKVQDLIKDLNKMFEELIRNPENQEKVNALKIKHDDLFCGFDTTRMNTELTRIQNQRQKEEMIKEKLIEANSVKTNKHRR